MIKKLNKGIVWFPYIYIYLFGWLYYTEIRRSTNLIKSFTARNRRKKRNENWRFKILGLTLTKFQIYLLAEFFIEKSQSKPKLVEL